MAGQEASPKSPAHVSRPTAPKKLTIKPFRRAPKVPENFFADTWSTFLGPAVYAVHSSQTIPFSLEVLYRKVEDVCMHKHTAELFTVLERACEEQAAKLIQPIQEHFVDNMAFLTLVDDTWRGHCSQMLRIRAIFLKLDRTYFLQGVTQTARSLWDMGLAHFRTQFMRAPHLERRTVESLLGLVNQERDGDTIDSARFRSLVRMFSAIELYADRFEPLFLGATSDYYKSESERLTASLDVPSYLRHVERCLHKESERVSESLDPTTRKPLIELVEQRLLVDQIPNILEKGFDSMCDEGRIEDLRRCHALFARVNQKESSVPVQAHTQMKERFIAYIKGVGLDIVMDSQKDSKMVRSLLDMKERIDELVAKSFGGSTLMANAANYAFGSFVNARENKPAELIAKFLDSILRTGNKTYSEDELETTLDRVLTLFRYIDGKDVFEAFYKKDLSKRLLYDKSASHDLEKAMISKLKAECGSQFTSKLEAMFRDVDASKDLMTSFRQLTRAHGDDLETRVSRRPSLASDRLDLNVFVLEAARWPLATQRAEVKLPKELVDYQESYKRFYLGKHSGRKLTWQHFDGSCSVMAHFPMGTKILSLSLYQTIILMLFNGVDEMSLKDIASNTGVEDVELRRTLLSLACGKVRVLQKRPKGPQVNDGDDFLFNSAFSHKQVRIKVNAIQMKETVEENTGTTEKVFQERSYQIDASLVRIMKTRRTLHHTALISEVYTQLRFPYRTIDIKKRIESLIERDYMERDPNDPQVYLYVA